jgi:osmotically-inducible protein OsmY
MLEDQLYVRLAERAWVGGDFRATVNQGVVTLSGTVPSEQSKQKMLRIARQTAGVTELRDQLRVDPSVSAQRDARAPVGDSELAKRVAQKIAGAITGAKAGEEWWFSGWRVEGPDRHWNTTVEADNGAVTLEGDVPYDSIVRKSVEAALQVPGVRSVRSEITIERTSGRYSPYYGYGPYGYGDGYPYGPPYVHDFRGFHAMTGEVTKIDPQKGTVTLKTDTETFDLHFPPAFLQNVKQGSKDHCRVGAQGCRRGGRIAPHGQLGGSGKVRHEEVNGRARLKRREKVFLELGRRVRSARVIGPAAGPAHPPNVALRHHVREEERRDVRCMYQTPAARVVSRPSARTAVPRRARPRRSHRLAGPSRRERC